MPFNELPRIQRRDSWPPTTLRVGPADTDLTSIDDNPISFFLTPPDSDIDLDDYLSDDDLSAGISSSSPKIREISPSSIQRAALSIPAIDEEEEEIEDDFEAPMTLRDFTAKHNSGRQSRQGHNKNEGLGLGITLPDHTAMRGRARVKLLPARGRG
ncbi:hypothetical protein LSUE1_G008821, partial [Lachnellula suecica]